MEIPTTARACLCMCLCTGRLVDVIFILKPCILSHPHCDILAELEKPLHQPKIGIFSADVPFPKSGTSAHLNILSTSSVTLL